MLRRVAAFALFLAAVSAWSATQACEATPTPPVGTTESLSITCGPGQDRTIDVPYTVFLSQELDIDYDGNGDDTLTINGANLTILQNPSDPFDFFIVETFGGNDTFVMSSGSIVADPNDPAAPIIFISMGDGNDLVDISGGTIGGSVEGDDGADTFNISGGLISEAVRGGDGANVFNISGGVIGSPDIPPTWDFGVDGGEDTDVINISGGQINGDVHGASGDDRVSMSAGSAWSLVGADGNDDISVSGTAVLGDGFPRFIGGGRCCEDDPEAVGGVFGQLGDDRISISGGTIQNFVSGGAGNDIIQFSGGTLSGDVGGAEGNDVLTITGGAISGGIFDTEIINLLGGSVGGDIVLEGIGSMPSLLRINGARSLGGTLFASNATIDMRDGAADDVLTLGGLEMSNSAIGIDVDQNTALSDRIIAGQAQVNGTNFIDVALLNAPVFTGQTDIPILVGGDLDAADFIVRGAADDPASMFDFSVAAGPDGGLVLRATPRNIAPSATTQAAIDSRPIETASDTLEDITGDAADSGLGLAKGGQVQITPSFGVFSAGQFGHVEHDGFEVSDTNGAFIGTGPSFEADDFSAALSFDFDAAKHFGFDDQYGLNLGVFGGYASSDVSLGAFQGFTAVGDATNESILAGGYGLFRQGVNYALVSATTFIGETDIVNNVLNSTGSYDTVGYAVTASAGRIFALTDRVRFDLRAGILGATFEGDEYTDSTGVTVGTSKVSFGALKFEPGIYADYQLENGMVVSPYLRADLQQRFDYENSGKIGGVELSFDDADFSAALSGGFNMKFSRATLSAEVRGKMSSDSSTVAGKLGLKIGF